MIASAKEIDALNITLFNSCINFTNVHLCNNRLRVHHAKFEHFISFITSPHIIQDVPFGEKIIKLSTGEEITTPYVI